MQQDYPTLQHWYYVPPPFTVFSMLLVGATLLAGAGANGYMFRYTDNEPWWNPVPMNVPRLVGQFVFSMAADSNAVVAGTSKGVFRSTDQGLSWEATPFALPPQTIQILFLIHGSTLFAVTASPVSSSLFASSDAGASWKPIGVYPLPNMLAGAVLGNTLFLGGAGGLWEASLQNLVTSAADRGKSSQGFALRQNYPNPFNPSTDIQFTVTERQLTVLKVIDLLGREVATLVNEVKDPGTYVVRFDGAEYSSGMYFYLLKAGSFSQVKHMALLK